MITQQIQQALQSGNREDLIGIIQRLIVILKDAMDRHNAFCEKVQHYMAVANGTVGSIENQRDELLRVLTLLVDTGFPVIDEHGDEHWAIPETIRAQGRQAIAKSKE